MILIRSKRVKEILKLLGKSQSWLCEKLTKSDGGSYKPSMISRMIRNHCQIPRNIIEKLPPILHQNTDDIFIRIPMEDHRHFWGKDCFDLGLDVKAMTREEYDKWLTRQFAIYDNGNGQKKF